MHTTASNITLAAPSHAQAWQETLPTMLFGVLIYGYLFGYATLNPANVAWMMQGDPAQHYLGWQFFRCEPWQWPLGRINSYGYPAGTTIVFSDAIPLLALAFKPFNALLGSEFQYFGLWILSCYLLTGLFAQRLMGWFTPHPWLRMLGACLFILSPPMLMRGYGHEALMAHWLLLAAMHGFLAAWSPRKWLLLLVTAALTHPYLLLMVLGLWLASITPRQQPLRASAWQAGGKQILLILPPLLLVMLAAGYLKPGGGGVAGEGYGFFSMNMLALIQPDFIGTQHGASRLIGNIGVATAGQYEGYLYLGAGMLLLGFVASLACASRKLRPAATAMPADNSLALRNTWPLLMIAFAFWCLALSNQITLGPYHLANVPLPASLHTALSTFRASGRLGWPLFYLLNLILLGGIVRHLAYRPALALLSLALLLQVVDLSAKYKALRNFIHARSHWETPLKSPAWSRWAADAERLILLTPPAETAQIYLPFAELAARRHLATNAAHTARANEDQLTQDVQQTRQALTQGRADPRTLYILPAAQAWPSLPAALQARISTQDGYAVLPPAPPTP